MKFDTRKIYYVYVRRRMDNNSIFYIGKGKDDRYLVFKRNVYHDRTAKKYGYYTEIINENLSEIEALELEKSLIEKHWGNITNIVKDSVISTNTLQYHPKKDEIFKKIGESIKKTWNSKSVDEKREIRLRSVSVWKKTWNNKTSEDIEEWKSKISEKHKNKIIPLHIKEKIKKSTTGDLNHFYGKHHTDETKTKISNHAKLRWENIEYRNKMLTAFRKKEYTDELIEKLKINGSKGATKRYSNLENRKKQSEAIAGIKNGRAIFYKCTINNKIYFGLTPATIQDEVVDIFNSYFSSNYYPSMVVKGITYILKLRNFCSNKMVNIINSKPVLFTLATKEEYLNQ